MNAAQKLQELGLQLNPAIPYNLDYIFPKTEGWGANGDIQRKHKLLVNNEGFLQRILMEKEQVLYIAKGMQYKFSEQYFMGIWATLINQTVFVLTNFRIIMIHSDTRGNPKDMYWMIYYNQIQDFKISLLGMVSSTITTLCIMPSSSWLVMWQCSSRPPTKSSRRMRTRIEPPIPSISATSCGVETTTAPVSGQDCARLSATSPVPGGRSTMR